MGHGTICAANGVAHRLSNTSWAIHAQEKTGVLERLQDAGTQKQCTSYTHHSHALKKLRVLDGIEIRRRRNQTPQVRGRLLHIGTLGRPEIFVTLPA